MADFLTAYKRTDIAEGGYSFDPDDPGGETWRGIARKRWPRWRGWDVIDAAKSKPGFPGNLENEHALEDLRKDFYFANFWLPIRGGQIKSQLIANEIYDDAVNTGVTSAVWKAYQTAGIKPLPTISDDLLRLINNET